MRIIFVSYVDVDLRGYILAGNIYISESKITRVGRLATSIEKIM